MMFSANKLSRAWLSVAQASAKDDRHPALSKTMAVEIHPKGIRLVATDSYVLLHAWVPKSGAEQFDEPPLHVAPKREAVAMDAQGRAKALFSFLLNKTQGKDAIDFDVALELTEVDEEDTGTFEGMEISRLALEDVGSERLLLPLFEGPYVGWRLLLDDYVTEKTEAIALNTEIVGRLAKLGTWFSEPLLWHFGGSDRVAMVEIGDADLKVSGLVMPVRVNWGEE